MKTNVFPFELDANLIDDVGCLLQFIKQPLPLDKFFKKFPKQFLNAKLEQLEFDYQDLDETFFNISLKARWKNRQIRLTSELLSPFGITVTDKNHFIEKLRTDEFLKSKLTLKESLKNIIDSHTKKIINLNIDNFINLKRENSLQLPENREKKVNIRLFFIFLKIFIQRNTLTNIVQLSSPELINSAAYLTTCFAFEINNFIACLNDNLTFAAEPTEKSKKGQQETNISKMVFSYDQLRTKLTDLTPSLNQKDIKQLLDSMIENSMDSKLIPQYDFFKQAYFSEKGFVCVFGDYSGYDSIQICRKKLDYFRKNYQNFLQLIEELTTHANKIPEITFLAATLKERTDIYFHSLLYNSVFKEEKKGNLDTTAFKNFEFGIKNKISNFQKNYLCTVKIDGALNKILDTLAKWAPKFLISKEKRMLFFYKKMPEVKVLDRVETTMPLMKI